MTPERMAEIHAACFPQRPWSAGELAALAGQSGARAVFEKAGFALARNIAGEAELLTIAVLPSAQGKGRGEALLRALIDDLQNNGCTKLFLEVADDNAPALALYAKTGFRQIGLRKAYYARSDGSHTDAQVMELALP